MGGNFPLGIVVTAVDRASQVLAGVEQNTKRLANTFDSFRGRLNNAFQYHVIYRSLNLIERGLWRVANAFPDLVQRGADWARTVDEVADATGLSARRASELAAIQDIVGDGTDNLSRAFIVFARNAVSNSEAFARMGVATRDANGRMLDAYTIFQNARERISATGGSLLATAAAQKVFGRGAHDLIDLLSLTNEQWRIYASEARRSGLILTEAGLHAAEQWQRTQKMLDHAFTGIGAQVLQAVAPALISLSNGVTTAIQQNLANITRFAVQVVNFLAGLVGGFLGIDFGAATVADEVERAGNAAEKAGRKQRGLTAENIAGTKAAKGAASGQDAYSKSLQRSIDAIDRQLRALERTDRRDESRRTQRDLLADIAQARKELADVRSESIFAAGMSEAEAELARQAQARDVVQAQDRVRDAERRLRDERRDQERQDQRDRLQQRRDDLQRTLAAHRQAASRIGQTAAGIGKSFSAGFKPVKDLGEKGLPKLTSELKGVASEARKAGQAIADGIQDAIFGEDQTVLVGTTPVTIRSGGLLSALQALGGHLGNLVKLIGPNTDAIVTLGGIILGWKLINAIPGVGTIRNNLPPVIRGGGGKGGAGGGSGLGGLFGKAGALAFGVGLAVGGIELLGNTVPEERRQTYSWRADAMTALKRGASPEWVVAMLKGRGASDAEVNSIMKDVLGGKQSVGSRTYDMPNGANIFGTRIAPRPAGMPSTSLPGGGMADPLIFLRLGLRPFLGPDSPLARQQGTVADNTGAAASYGAETAGNTGPISDGTVGIGKWGAGRLGVSGIQDKVAVRVQSKNDFPTLQVQMAGAKAITRADMVYLAAIINSGQERIWERSSLTKATVRMSGDIRAMSRNGFPIYWKGTSSTKPPK